MSHKITYMLCNIMFFRRRPVTGGEVSFGSSHRIRVDSGHVEIIRGVMPALVAGIHVFLGRISGPQGVDGRDKPGHDGAEKCFNVSGKCWPPTRPQDPRSRRSVGHGKIDEKGQREVAITAQDETRPALYSGASALIVHERSAAADVGGVTIAPIDARLVRTSAGVHQIEDRLEPSDDVAGFQELLPLFDTDR
jgi:hypothetical protein